MGFDNIHYKGGTHFGKFGTNIRKAKECNVHFEGVKGSIGLDGKASDILISKNIGDQFTLNLDRKPDDIIWLEFEADTMKEFNFTIKDQDGDLVVKRDGVLKLEYMVKETYVRPE